MKHYIDTKYTRWYQAIVRSRREQPLPADHYSEDHHIIPESFYKQRTREGPPGWLDGDPEDPSNRVRLTAREHFVCHWLLVKMTTGIAHIKMRDALEMMGVKAEHQHRYSSGITSRVFERNRIEVAKIRSERMMGENNPAKKPGVGEAIAATKRGKKREPFSPKWIANLCKANSGEGNGMYGKKHSEETLRALREKGEQYLWVHNGVEDLRVHQRDLDNHLANGWLRGRAPKGKTGPREKILCPHCGAYAAANTFKRWHGDNCKHR